MVGKQNVPFMKRCGLTFEQLAAAYAMEPGEPEDWQSFSIRMRNDVKLSSSDRPSVPTAVGRLELVRAELQDDLLTIADIKGERRAGDSKVAESVGARLYARRTISLEGVTAFMFLSQPPPGVADDRFFAAEGTVVLFDNAPKGPRMLKACGIDRSNGQCISWIFDAIEA
jgi:hypothetical protein